MRWCTSYAHRGRKIIQNGASPTIQEELVNQLVGSDPLIERTNQLRERHVNDERVIGRMLPQRVRHERQTVESDDPHCHEPCVRLVIENRDLYAYACVLVGVNGVVRENDLEVQTQR